MTVDMLPGVEGAGSDPVLVDGGRHRRRGSPLARIGLALVLVAGLVWAVSTRYLDGCRAPEGPHDPVTFTVDEGASGSEVVAGLHEQGVVPCEAITRWDLRRSGLADELRTGTYELTTNMAPDEAFAILTAPPPEVPTERLTIPEGFRITQIAERVHEDLGIPVPRFLKAIDRTDWSLPPYLPASASGPEGFLFPNTYEFVADGTNADDVIARLLEEFGKQAESLPWDNAERLGLTPYEIVVVASMIEEEARVDGDRALISAVIHNRLEVGMTLGIDATLQYVDPDPSNGLVTSDFEIDSPYNTRISAGLPPTPIASPGIESLRAALEPADVTYLYYVLCGEDGSHAFSDSFAQFTADKNRCLG